MKRIELVSLLLVLGLWAGCSTPGALSRYEGKNYVIHSRGKSQDEIEALSKDVDLIFGYYKTLFRVPDEQVWKLHIHLEEHDTDYEYDDYPALYRSSTQSIHFCRVPDRMLLLHEIAHHFIRIRMGEPPVWLDEGMATYLGWSAMDEDRIVVGEIPVAHFKTLKTCGRDRTLLPLEDLFALSPAEFYSDEDNLLHYSQSWGFVFYLFHVYLDPWRTFSTRLDMLERMNDEEFLVLERPFHRFCRDFSAAQMMRERLYSGIHLRQLSSAFRLGLLQDESTVEDLLDVAMNHTRDELLRCVALHAGAMIVVGTQSWRGRARLAEVLDDLNRQSKEPIHEAARNIHEAIKRGDRREITSRFAEFGQGCAFYPASHFLIKSQGAEKEGMGALGEGIKK